MIGFEDTGTYQVRYIASNGSRSDTLTKEVIILPKIEKNFLGNDTGWCEQLGSSIDLKAPENMHCYEWNTGATGNEITADTAGVYIVKITTPNFCVLYDTLTVTIDTTPNVPTIYRDNDTLKTDAVSPKYHWFRDNISIGTNQPSLVITDTGIYRLQVMSNGGCTAFSDTIHIPADTTTDNVKYIPFSNLKVYPNPFNNSISFEQLNFSEQLNIKIYNQLGVMVSVIETNSPITEIETLQWNEGVYLIEINNSSKQFIKLIKLNR